MEVAVKLDYIPVKIKTIFEGLTIDPNVLKSQRSIMVLILWLSEMKKPILRNERKILVLLYFFFKKNNSPAYTIRLILCVVRTLLAPRRRIKHNPMECDGPLSPMPRLMAASRTSAVHSLAGTPLREKHLISQGV